MVIIMNSIILIISIIIIVFLQIFLSKKKSKIPGLILPFIILLCSTISFISSYNYTDYNYMEGLKILILVNILTAIFIYIYFYNRKKCNNGSK